MTVVATWNGVAIDPALLIGYGYTDTILINNAKWPRYIAYVKAGIDQLATDAAGYNATFTANVATATATLNASVTTATNNLNSAVSTANTNLTAAVTAATNGMNAAVAQGKADVAASVTAGQATFAGTLSGLVATSSTTAAIRTGSLSLSTGTALGFTAGLPVLVYVTTDPSRWMWGAVASYDTRTGALVVTVAQAAGSGSGSAWSIAPASTPGPMGAQGPQGPVGSGSSINGAQDGTFVTAAPRATLNATYSIAATDDAANGRIVLSLQNDVLAPAPNQVYGTDLQGRRGWYKLSDPALIVTPLSYALGQM